MIYLKLKKNKYIFKIYKNYHNKISYINKKTSYKKTQ